MVEEWAYIGEDTSDWCEEAVTSGSITLSVGEELGSSGGLTFEGLPVGVELTVHKQVSEGFAHTSNYNERAGPTHLVQYRELTWMKKKLLYYKQWANGELIDNDLLDSGFVMDSFDDQTFRRTKELVYVPHATEPGDPPLEPSGAVAQQSSLRSLFADTAHPLDQAGTFDLDVLPSQE